MNDPKHMLDLAASLAWRGLGEVEPNPMVGCVICRDGRVIGAGHHRRFGDLHAEREALADCARRGEDPRGSTVFVTLEPCRHTGKQPPCTAALIEAGVERVVYAVADPAGVSAGGAGDLVAAGIEVAQSDASPFAQAVSAPFRRRIATGLPWVIAKWAQTIDGRIATRTGDSQWISNELSRRRVHRLRSRVDAILSGIGTVLADDPQLTARGVGRVRRIARRVVLDAKLEIPLDSKLVRSAGEAPLTVVCAADAAADTTALEAAGVEVWRQPTDGDGRISLRALLERMSRDHGITTVMTECGPGVLGSLFAENLVDTCLVYLAPTILADNKARPAADGMRVDLLGDAHRYELARVKQLRSDLELIYTRSEC